MRNHRDHSAIYSVCCLQSILKAQQRHKSNGAFAKTLSLPCGFTLLEILIALFIFTVIAMLSTSVLHTVISAYEGTENKAGRLRDLQTGLLLLSREVSQAIDRPILNAIGKEEGAFVGTPRGFTFTHLALENPLLDIKKNPLGRSGFFWHKEKLWRVTWPAVDQPPKIKAKASILLGDVTYANFAYLDGEGRLHDTWPVDTDANRTLPRAIKMELTLKSWGKISQTYPIVADPIKPINPPPTTKEKKELTEEDDDEDEKQGDHHREEKDESDDNEKDN